MHVFPEEQKQTKNICFDFVVLLNKNEEKILIFISPYCEQKIGSQGINIHFKN